MSAASVVRCPPNEMARSTLEDVIHYYVERILQTTVEDRVECFKSLAYFWGFHPARDLEFGYHYVRVRLAELLVQGFCGSSFGKVAGATKDDDSSEGDDGAEQEPFVNWTRQQWLDLRDDLNATVALAYRADSTVELKGEEDDGLEDETPTEQPEWLLMRHGSLQDRFLMCAVVAPIRAELEAIVKGEATGLQDESLLYEIVEYVESEIDEEEFRHYCRRLYVRSADDPEAYRLAEVKEIDRICRHLKPLKLQQDLDKTIQQLAFEVFGTKEPELIKLRYRLPSGDDDINDRDARRARVQVEALRANRLALNENVRDPLEEIRGAASQHASASAARSGGAGGASPRKRGGRSAELRFDDDDGDESVLDPPPELSELQPPRKKRSINASHRVDKDHPPDDGLFDRNGNVTRRIPWSHEEKEAVRKGVGIFGVGKWSEIKKHFGEIFRNRTSVQIKDAWRTMLLKGEVAPNNEESEVV